MPERGLLLACLLAASCAGEGGEAAGEPKGALAPLSTLLVTLDTTRADALSCYGVVEGTTPHLDRLAAEGVLYVEARTVAPLTLPAHCSMLTGLYPLRHGVRTNGAWPLTDEATTLAERARSAGFQTAAFVAAVVLDATFGLAQGFDVYDAPRQELRPMSSTFAERTATEVVDAALSWLRSRDRARPFFLWVHLFDPHSPYAPPARFLEAVPDRNPYLGEVAYADEEIGRLLLELAFDGSLVETLVVVTSDHGEGLGEHDETQHSAYCYDSTMHVPLIVRYPDGHGAGRRSREIVSVVDVAPTLAAAMALDPLGGARTGAGIGIDGQSLFRRSVDGEGGEEKRGVYMESYYGYLSYGWSQLAGWADAEGKYLASSEPEFYVPHRDRYERVNRIAETPVEGYREAIARLAELPALAAGEGTVAAELVEKVRDLGYAAGDVPAGDLPHPLEQSELPSPASMASEQLRLQRAMFLTSEERCEEAAEIFAEILDGNPRNHRAVEHMTFCLMQLGRHAEAIAPLERAVALSPGLPDAHAYLGLCYLASDRPEDSRAAFERALAIRSEHVQALLGMSRALSELGREEEARAFRERVEALLGPG